MLNATKQVCDVADLEIMFEVYSKFRTEAENRTSDDILVTVLPGAPPNTPSNSDLQKVFDRYKHIVPKHQSPKVGVVELHQQDLLRRVKGKASWQGKCEDNIVFTQERKGHNCVSNKLCVMRKGGRPAYRADR